MTVPLSIICPKETSGNDEALAALAAFLGVPVRLCAYGELREAAGGAGAVSGETLARLMREGILDEFREFAGKRLSSLLVYGVEPRGPIGEALGRFTGGLVRDLRAPESAVHGYEIAKGAGTFCRQMAGLSLEPREGRDDYVLAMGEVPGAGGGRPAEVFVSIGGRPFFAGLKIAGCEVFVMACGRVADVRGEVDERAGARALFSGLAPPAMYIKHVFGEAAWHSERDRACLIVDDPLLREKYGFLNYRALAGLMDSFDFTASIGFIPWNFRRTAGEVADLLNARTDRFSLCVHGCDHTRSEFGSLDDRDLERMTRTALERMNRHESLTGVAFDRIMIFPQGVFSTRAMAALKAGGYLAAVNSEAIPVDFGRSLPAAAFLEPAITAFGGFPLFVRRWPEDTEGLATDLFWGRPALVTAHHDFFKDGCRRLIDFLGRIGSVNADIEWRSLGDIVRRSHLLRAEPDDATRPRVRVKSYVTDMVVGNDTPVEKRYVVAAPDSGDVPVRVLSGGIEMDYEASEGRLEVSFILPPHRRKAVTVLHPRPAPGHMELGTTAQAMRTRIRRYLSEIRDNYISRNRPLLSVATTLKDLFLVPGRSRRPSGPCAR